MHAWSSTPSWSLRADNLQRKSISLTAPGVVLFLRDAWPFTFQGRKLATSIMVAEDPINLPVVREVVTWKAPSLENTHGTRVFVGPMLKIHAYTERIILPRSPVVPLSPSPTIVALSYPVGGCLYWLGVGQWPSSMSVEHLGLFMLEWRKFFH